ncbi:MAG TPA: hypothetical protein VLW84_07080 [Terriglobales bacterium]|nr:hypothetical protein [Terriglobales bacterium]
MSLVTQELRAQEAQAQQPRNDDTVQALVQLLRGRSAEEIRQRMYDNPPGSNWWTACKTELDLRNGERMAHALVETARVLEKMSAATEHLDEMTEQAAQRTNEIAEIVQHVRDAGRRMEIATYVILGVAVLQLFYIAYQVSTKHP